MSMGCGGGGDGMIIEEVEEVEEVVQEEVLWDIPVLCDHSTMPSCQLTNPFEHSQVLHCNHVAKLVCHFPHRRG